MANAFFAFLRGPALEADALFILGDLFEYWVGDDDDDRFCASVTQALRELTSSGTSLYLMHGNRDFLIGHRCASSIGARLLSDPHVMDLYGVCTMLMHGDTLCTDDARYQQFRAMVRAPDWIKGFLAKPLEMRKQIAAGLRETSNREKKLKTEEIMDVTPTAVESALRAHGYPRLIHGHTHRPAKHTHHVDGRECERWVLADWYERGTYLRVDAKGCVCIALKP